jgi:mono/diheme cytochrome c family protein
MAMRLLKFRKISVLLGRALAFALPAFAAIPVRAAEVPLAAFVEKNCVDCHDAESKKGGLDLTALKFDPGSRTNFAAWVLVHDRVSAGEMPPAKKKQRPDPAELAAFTNRLAATLTATDREAVAREGRATRRRLNRFEYENALRDLLHAPWLQIRDSLPEDGLSHRFNKLGDALDVSYVQMARYLAAADHALREAMATQAERPPTKTVRYYTRDQGSYTGPMTYTVFNTSPERATFPVLGFMAQPDVRASKAPITVGSTNAELRELEGVGVVAGSYEPLEPKFNRFRAPVGGHYRLRFKGYSVWVGPSPTNRWFIPDLDTVSKGRRSEPVTVYSETPPRLLRKLGNFDVTPEPSVQELDVWLLAGETIRADPARLFRSRPGAGRFQNPLAERDGQPGVVFRWLEVDGPIYDQWPTLGHRLLFGDLPVASRPAAEAPLETNQARASRRFTSAPGVDVISQTPLADAERLLRNFVKAAYRRPAAEQEYRRFLPVIAGALKSGSRFADAMIAGYTAVLCSPEFVNLEEKPGRLDDFALAARLSFFLENTSPDAELRRLASAGELHRPGVLRAQTDRLLDDPKSRQFVDAFLDYWIDLRKIDGTAPDSTLYPDYYLDDLLTESAQAETQLFFTELVRGNLPARNLVASDFAMLNERLAVHYGLPPFEGACLRRVPLPPESPRGGLLTQASVLKVTANGTTTSPVLRGAWVMERILGRPVPPPPPGVPAIEPDIRGAVTLRQQLEKHRSQQSCNVCHAKIDPAGFALESFDVMGGWRDRYRADGEGKPDVGIGKGGQKFTFHSALPVDPSGELPDGRKFADVRDLKRLLLADEPQVARNLVRQLAVYATGAPIRFSDRPEIETILERTRADQYGVRSLIRELVQSRLFREK